MKDWDDLPEQQYDRTGTGTMSTVLLLALVAVIGLIGGLAAWTGA